MLESVDKISACFFTVLFAVVFLSGCGGDRKQDRDVGRSGAAAYEDWQTYTYQNVKFIYPPEYPLESTLGEQARQYVAATERGSRFFEIDVPQDTLVVYFYTGYGQGRELTGREYPYCDSTGIHFWLPSYPGVTLMQWLLPHWQTGEPRYEFLKHGLISLLDYSGQNYHVATMNYVSDGSFIPLAELAADTAVDSDIERHQSALSASFVDYISYYYGIEALKVLYRSQTAFEDAVEGIFMMPVDSLESHWLSFAQQRAQEAEGADLTEP